MPDPAAPAELADQVVYPHIRVNCVSDWFAPAFRAGNVFGLTDATGHLILQNGPHGQCGRAWCDGAWVLGMGRAEALGVVERSTGANFANEINALIKMIIAMIAIVS